MSHGNRPGPETAEPSRGPLQSPSEPGTTGSLGSSNSSRLESSTQGSGFPSTSQETLASSEGGRLRALKKLEEVTESYRGGKTTKTEAISSILRIIGEDSDVAFAQPQREAAFDSYLTEILAVPSTRDDPEGPESSGTRPDVQPSVSWGSPDQRWTAPDSTIEP